MSECKYIHRYKMNTMFIIHFKCIRTTNLYVTISMLLIISKICCVDINRGFALGLSANVSIMTLYIAFWLINSLVDN